MSDNLKATLVMVGLAALWAMRARSKNASNKESDYRITPLRREHKEGVLEIARVTYGGHDWIGSAFDSWFNGSFVPLALEHVPTGQVAGLFVMRLNGRFGCLEALRVHPNHRNRNLGHRLQSEMIKMARRRQNELKLSSLRYTAYDGNTPSIKVATKSGFKVTSELPYVMLTEEPADPSNIFIVRSGEGSILRFLKDCETSLSGYNPKKFYQAQGRSIDDPKILFSIVSTLGRTLFYHDWKPYDLTEADAAYLLSNTSNLDCFSVDDGRGGVSFGVVRPDFQGNICNLTIYWWADEAEGMKIGRDPFVDLVAHLAHWRVLVEKNNITSMYISYPYPSHNAMKGLGLVPVDVPKRELVFEFEL